MNKIFTLVYLQKDNQTLFLLRSNKSEDEVSTGKYLGVGGKVDPNDDSIESAAKRETLEETGFVCNSLTFKGIVEFVGQKEYILETHIFTSFDFSGELKEDPREGTLHWIENDKIHELNMWEGDREFISKLFEDKEFKIRLEYNSEKKLIDVKEI